VSRTAVRLPSTSSGQAGRAGQAIEVRQPRVNDRRVDEQGRRFQFTSQILPPYLRKAKAIEELVPWLHLKGICAPHDTEALMLCDRERFDLLVGDLGLPDERVVDLMKRVAARGGINSGADTGW
jgi:hypothetical protein